jgi:2-haloacid dehalogenase
MRTVSAALFDIGGVILDWNPRHLYRQLVADDDEIERFLEEVCTLEWHAAFDRGEPMDAACSELARQHPDDADLIEAWKRQDEMVNGEIEGTRAVIEHLRDAGVALYLITNMPAADYATRLERFEVLSLFDGAIVSGLEGVIKPDPRIFERAIERFDLDPAMTLFVDDSERNVAVATSLGMIGHRFTSAEQLRAFVDS